MTRMTTLFTIAFVCTLAALLLTACGSPTGNATAKQTVAEQDIVIGSIMPLSGDAAAYGIPLQRTADLAVNEINAAGGINGHNLRVIYEDGACTAKGATTAAQKLIAVDGVHVILGGLCSGETLGAAPLAQENHVILFSSASGSPDITNAGSYIYRNFPSDATSGSKVAKAALENGHKRIAIISEQTDYAQAVARVFRESYVANGGTVIVDEKFTSDTNDFRGALTKVKAANPDAVYLLGQTPARFGQLLKQTRELGLTQQLYTNEFAAAGEILTSYTDEIEGAIYAEPAFNENAPQATQLFDKYRAAYQTLPDALPPVYLATTYDAVYILRDAMVACGEDTTCIQERLLAVKDRVGAAGSLTIDSNGDAQFEYVLRVIKSNKPTIVEGNQ